MSVKDRRQLIIGNWKMNGLKAQRAEIETLIAGRKRLGAGPDVVICPPHTLVNEYAHLAGNDMQIGGQDCHALENGAFTGDISAEMLQDAGASFVIVGHSERRQYHQESDSIVAAKLAAAWRAGLHPILCVGESLAEREAGATLSVINRQIDGALSPNRNVALFSLAYEPIWAIGTGKTPTSHEIAEIHAHIRQKLLGFDDRLGGTRLLYGGSVNPQNAGAILALPNVDGALVGGASLKSQDFLAIIAAAVQR